MSWLSNEPRLRWAVLVVTTIVLIHAKRAFAEGDEPCNPVIADLRDRYGLDGRGPAVAVLDQLCRDPSEQAKRGALAAAFDINEASVAAVASLVALNGLEGPRSTLFGKFAAAFPCMARASTSERLTPSQRRSSRRCGDSTCATGIPPVSTARVSTSASILSFLRPCRPMPSALLRVVSIIKTSLPQLTSTVVNMPGFTTCLDCYESGTLIRAEQWAE